MQIGLHLLLASSCNLQLESLTPRRIVRRPYLGVQVEEGNDMNLPASRLDDLIEVSAVS